MKISTRRGARALTVLALVVGVLTALGVSPAAARPAQAIDTSACGWSTPGSALFSGLSSFQFTNLARSADPTTRQEPARPGIADDTEIADAASAARIDDASFSAKVRVFFHVITDGDLGRVTNAQIKDQITALNLTFGGFRGGAGTGFRFELKDISRTNNAGWFAQDNFDQEVSMKTALKRGDSTDLNIYSTSGGGFLGWSYYPSIVKSKRYSVLDGIVIHYGSVPGGFLERFNLGFTAVHEAGHWLGLAHTFENGCAEPGDRVDDTPFEAEPSFGCPRGKDTCPAPGRDPIHNYMDYSDDACYTQFTEGQSQRTHRQWTHWRLAFQNQ